MNLTTRLASALLALGDVPYAHAKRMTAAQLISLYEWDHNVRKAQGGPDDFWNLTPRLKSDHREKTKRDLGEIAKAKRIRSKHEAHLQKMRDK